MEKNNKSLWIGIIIVVVLVALYFLATRGGSQDQEYNMNADLDAVPASFEDSAIVEGAIVDGGFFVEGEMPAIDEPAVVNDGLVEEINIPFDPGAMEAGAPVPADDSVAP